MIAAFFPGGSQVLYGIGEVKGSAIIMMAVVCVQHSGWWGLID